MKTALSLLLLASLTQAWSINGHLFVANIAQDLLEEKAPASLEAALQMLTYLREFDPEMTNHEDMHPFVETSTFADDLKYHGEAWQGDFHFQQQPWIEEGEASDYNIKLRSRNLTDGLESIVGWLSGKQGDAYLSSYMYTFLMAKYSDNEDLAKSYALRLLIHLIGDIVQPFHSENRWNSEFSADGDKGANLFPLKYHYEVDELHALWDKVLYT